MASHTTLIILAIVLPILFLVCVLWALIFCLYSRVSTRKRMKIVPKPQIYNSYSQSDLATIEIASSVPSGSLGLDRQFSSASSFPIQDYHHT